MIEIDGRKYITHGEAEAVRALKKDNIIIAQKGGQEKMLSCPAQILIGGGCRGGAKSFTLLLDTLYDIYNPNFNAVILRNELDDLSDLVNVSQGIFRWFGEYNRSRNDMRWMFDKGGSLRFSYHADGIDDFRKRFQGKQYAYIGVDEITHMAFAKFKYLITTNRNAYGIRNRFIGTCNPDPDSWVAKFIEWWIGEDGLPIKERDGVIRYCFMDGDDVSSIIWGDTRKEVYEQCKDVIDALYKEEYRYLGAPEDLFVKSVAFVEAKLADNKKLLESDPAYLANLANQSEEQRARDLEGNWKFKSAGDDIIKMQHMEDFYRNPFQISKGVRYASCDAAFDGGDSLVMWLWVDYHMQDVFVCKHNSKDTIDVVKAKLAEWRVAEEHFTYDLNGIGQVFKGFFPKAMPFNNRESVDPKEKGLYDTIKSKAAYLFANKLCNMELSINPDILERKYSGVGFSNMRLCDILMRERKAIRKDNDAYDKGWCIIKKQVMKKIVGHSPDYIEGAFMRMVFDFKKSHRSVRNLGLL